MKYAATETQVGVYNMRPTAKDVESLTALIRDLHRTGIRMVEIGSYAGQSAQIFLETGLVSEIYCIDPWEKDTAAHANMKAVEAEFDGRFDGDGRVHKLKGRLADFADVFSGAQIDFVYIDAENDYEFIRDTVATIRSVLHPSIAIGGHDYGYVDLLMEAVDSVFGRTPDAVYPDSSWLMYSQRLCSVVRFNRGRMGNQLCGVLQVYKKAIEDTNRCYRFECAHGDLYRELCALGMRHLVLPPHTTRTTMAEAEHIDEPEHHQRFGVDFTKGELQGFIRKYILGSDALRCAEAMNKDVFGDTSGDDIVAIHMRETDYNTFIYRPFDRGDYLRRAFELIPPACKRVVIFTEDVDEAKKDFEESLGKIANRYDVVYVNPGMPEYDLIRFALFKNKIILNSSFAAWAGFVGNVVYPGTEKCVVSPDVCWRGRWDRHYFDSDWNFITTVSRRGRMPKIIHMLWLGNELPVFARTAIKGYRDANPGFDVRLTHYRTIEEGMMHDPEFGICVSMFESVRKGVPYENDDSELQAVYRWMLRRFDTLYRNVWSPDRLELLGKVASDDLPQWAMVCLAEVYRLFILRKSGGIYVDVDTYPLRGFDEHMLRQGDAKDGDVHFLLGSVPGVNLLCWYNEEPNEQPVSKFDDKLIGPFLRGEELVYGEGTNVWAYIMHAGAGSWRQK